ncbi:LysR family transcriptional regulator [Nonomuraea guangzhouensis]|uniref:LysR family transcriptional regulator n=1 Tax=Nonomuraea guangzhouensis TaxID=1291555 RepID=A0ABW4GGZ4_9ACTN|nr:LysR substrate-binding domain-containing protein [Nonomuraea guangzhouensis]
MNDLEVRQLRYFVAVAEELHFGRAAERLGMAQPPLSRAIRTLERRVGVRLLERTTRHVALTTAGEVFLRDARTALDAVTAAGRRARHAGQAEPRLRLALKADHDAGLLPRILSAYRGAEAALGVELVLGGRGEQTSALRDGRADVALVTGPFDGRGLDHQPLLTEPRLVALAAADPLAARSHLRLADLTGRRLPSGAPADQGGFPPPHTAIAKCDDDRPHAALAQGDGERPYAATALSDSDRPYVAIAKCVSEPPYAVLTQSDGERPQTTQRGLVTASGQSATDMTQILKLVELGSFVCFLPASIARIYPRPEIAYRTVDDLEPITLAVAWPQDARSAAVAAFVRTATAVAEAARTATAVAEAARTETGVPERVAT